MIQMQIPPPSTAHHSLLSEFLAPNNSASEDSEKDLLSPNQLQHQRPESCALRGQPSPFDGRTIPNFPKNVSEHNGRHQQQQQHQQQQHQQQQQDHRASRNARNARKATRGVTRRRSPSQKILSKPSGGVPKKEEVRDETGNPVPVCAPLTCFSYRTMEKEYEKDTMRMLERIQKSRSFEKKPKQEHGRAETNNPLQWSCPQLTSYSEFAAAATANLPLRVEDDSGFFIGEYGEEDEAVANDCVLIEDALGETTHAESCCEEDEDDGIFALDL